MESEVPNWLKGFSILYQEENICSEGLYEGLIPAREIGPKCAKCDGELFCFDSHCKYHGTEQEVVLQWPPKVLYQEGLYEGLIPAREIGPKCDGPDGELFCFDSNCKYHGTKQEVFLQGPAKVDFAGKGAIHLRSYSDVATESEIPNWLKGFTILHQEENICSEGLYEGLIPAREIGPKWAKCDGELFCFDSRCKYHGTKQEVGFPWPPKVDSAGNEV